LFYTVVKLGSAYEGKQIDWRIDNMMLWKIFGTNKETVAGGRRIFNDEERPCLYSFQIFLW